MPYKKGYKAPRRAPRRNYRRKPASKSRQLVTQQRLRIPRPINNRLGRTARINLVSDFQIYCDPKLSSSDSSGVQNNMAIRFCINSLYPFLESTAHGGAFIKNTNSTLNFEEGAVSYNMDSPNPSAATIARAIYDQGDWSVGRKYEKAYISGAKLSVFHSGVTLQNQSTNCQAGLLTLFAHNTDTNPFSVTTANKELKLLTPRVTRRVEPNVTAVQSARKSNLTPNTKLSLGVSVAKLNNITDINDDLENFGFSLGNPTDVGATPTATIPEKKSYISLAYTPALGSSMTGQEVQAPPCVLRVRLQQHCVLVSQKSHSQTGGVNWNIAQPYTTNYGYAKSMLAGGFAAAQAIRAGRHGNLHIMN
jgi:hypothetical protein